MSITDEELNMRLNDTYSRVKPYLKTEHPELKKMCETCECWYADGHNYEDCKDKPCFRFWLAHECLHYEIGWELNPGW